VLRESLGVLLRPSFQLDEVGVCPAERIAVGRRPPEFSERGDPAVGHDPLRGVPEQVLELHVAELDLGKLLIALEVGDRFKLGPIAGHQPGEVVLKAFVRDDAVLPHRGNVGPAGGEERRGGQEHQTHDRVRESPCAVGPCGGRTGVGTFQHGQPPHGHLCKNQSIARSSNASWTVCGQYSASLARMSNAPPRATAAGRFVVT